MPVPLRYALVLLAAASLTTGAMPAHAQTVPTTLQATGYTIDVADALGPDGVPHTGDEDNRRRVAGNANSDIDQIPASVTQLPPYLRPVGEAAVGDAPFSRYGVTTPTGGFEAAPFFTEGGALPITAGALEAAYDWGEDALGDESVRVTGYVVDPAAAFARLSLRDEATGTWRELTSADAQEDGGTIRFSHRARLPGVYDRAEDGRVTHTFRVQTYAADGAVSDARTYVTSAPLVRQTLQATVAPNPLAGPGTLHISGPAGATCEVATYNALGQRVARRRVRVEGARRLPLAATDFGPSGVYLTRVTCGDESLTTRTTVVR
jgi:hypothetical protein